MYFHIDRSRFLLILAYVIFAACVSVMGNGCKIQLYGYMVCATLTCNANSGRNTSNVAVTPSWGSRVTDYRMAPSQVAERNGRIYHFGCYQLPEYYTSVTIFWFPRKRTLGSVSGLSSQITDRQTTLGKTIVSSSFFFLFPCVYFPFKYETIH